MVYRMVFNVDGGCRFNGYDNAYGAAACCLMPRRSRRGYYYKTKRLPRGSHPRPTNQRAELLALVLALEWARDRNDELDGCPQLAVEIRTDSKYAHSCLTEWIFKWQDNGWTNARGTQVANRDLLLRAVELENWLLQRGTVNYYWIPRSENELADKHCNATMDEEEEKMDAYGAWNRSVYCWSSDGD